MALKGADLEKYTSSAETAVLRAELLPKSMNTSFFSVLRKQGSPLSRLPAAYVPQTPAVLYPRLDKSQATESDQPPAHQKRY